MESKLKKVFFSLCILISICAVEFSSFAGMQNPNTGDPQGQLLGIIIAALGVSLVVIIIVLAVSSKGKKKKK